MVGIPLIISPKNPRDTDDSSVSPFSITKDNASAVQVILDQRLVDSASKIAVHPSRSDITAFVSGTDIKSYLENTGVKVTVVEFSLLSVQAVSKPVTKQPTIKPKGPTIDGAELIGITTPKEVGFSDWYQQVLTKGDMLDYYDISGCYILKVGSSITISLSELRLIEL